MAVRLFVNPATDETFSAYAHACLADGGYTPTVLAEKLHAKYPRATVHPGLMEGEDRRWYVYREGHWVDA